MMNQLSRKLLAQIVASSHRALLRCDGDRAALTCGWLPSTYAQLSTTASYLQQSDPANPEPSTQPSGKKVLGSILLERLPVVAPALPQWYTDYEEWKFKEDEPYYRHYTGEFQQLRSGGEPVLDADLLGDPATHKAEIEAAENGDITSPWRRLDTRIFFLCKLRDRGEWTFPTAQHKEGETIRQTAERALQGTINTDAVKVYILGNQPACHWETDDSLIFYFRAQIIKGDLELTASARQRYAGYALLANDELGPYVADTAHRLMLHDVFTVGVEEEASPQNESRPNEET